MQNKTTHSSTHKMRLFELITFIAYLSSAAMARTHNFSERIGGNCDNPAFKAHEALSTPRGACPASFYPILLQMTKCAFFLSNRRPGDVPAYPSNGVPSLQPDPSDACDFWNVYLAAFPDLGEKAKEDPSFRHKFSRLKYSKEYSNGKLKYAKF
ncbi:hypothetical protein CI102_12408 [Trichoderma harzianum]|nr:hypothetical protein CI102_12408 [Trichoderma harzianum]